MYLEMVETKPVMSNVTRVLPSLASLTTDSSTSNPLVVIPATVKVVLLPVDPVTVNNDLASKLFLKFNLVRSVLSMALPEATKLIIFDVTLATCCIVPEMR